MANLQSLKPSLLELDFDKALALVEKIRDSRFAVKMTAPKKKRSEKTKKDLWALLKSMSPEEAKELVKKIGR